MKRFVLMAAATALVLSAPSAFADDHHGPHMSGPTNPPMGGPGSPQIGKPPSMPHGGPGGMPSRGGHGFGNHTPPPNPNLPPKPGTPPHFGNGSNGFKPTPGVTRPRGANVHIKINFNRRNVSAMHHYRYRGAAYHPPRDYRYRRWTYGQFMPAAYFAQDYWIDDFSAYGLAYPPDGAVWVRYGNDAVLVDQENGEILEVVYGQFY